DKELRFMIPEKLAKVINSTPDDGDFALLRRQYHFGSTVGEFWRFRLIQLTDQLERYPDVDLFKVLESAPEYICRELMSRGELVAYLMTCHGVLKEAAAKLSTLQKGILSIIHKETYGGIDSLMWVPLETLKENYTTADDLSRSLRELYKRGLLIKSGKRKTTAVQLTHLGFMVCDIYFKKIYSEKFCGILETVNMGNLIDLIIEG
ncbi:MAG: hypothetical protein WCD18_14715, partial [Thermosynechococcaceae cyanobacterium]